MIYLTGDIHGHIDVSRLSYKNNPVTKNLTEEDYLIILGDFGLIWNKQASPEEKYWLEWLNNKPWTTLVIDGNHENFDRLWDKEEFPDIEFCGATASKIRDKIILLHRGEIYNIENQKILVMGGGDSVDKQYRQENISWWPQETITSSDITKAFLNLKKYDSEVDYVLTHDCPAFLLPMCFQEMLFPPGESSKRLELLSKNIQFKRWYFGHLHIDTREEFFFEEFPHDKYQGLFRMITKLGGGYRDA